MRFTTYTKLIPGLADAVNLQALLDQLGDFLLQSGFAGGPGDWPWWADRDKTHLFSQWHNYKGQYRFNVLFGDSHTAFFTFPLEAYKWNYTGPKPDPTFTWW